ncbi:MAG: hypothetical protein ABIO46_04705 [Chitinophagales bacterium]
MNTTHQKRLLIFGSGYFIIYLVAAILLSEERIFLDGSYYFFHVVQSENFWVEHQRFILIPSQLLTWTAVKLHFPLQIVLLMNSVNPVLYLFLLFFICVYAWNDEAAGWVLLLLSVCGVYFLYFVPMYEVWYGAVLLVFFSSMMHRQFYRTPLQLLLLGVTVVTLLFSYPLMIFGFIFFATFHFLEIKAIPKKVAVLFLMVIIGWLVWKTLFISDYENGKISYPFSRIGITIRENLGSIGNIKALLSFLFSVYAEAMIMMVIAVLLLVFRKRYLKAALIVLFSSGYILLINVTHGFPWNHSNYYERMYLLLIPLCMLPFLREVYLLSKQKLLFEIVFICIILFRGIQIVQHSKVYSDRVERVRQFIQPAQKQGGSKFFVTGEQYPGDPALDEWSFPMEALIFSSLKTPEHTVIVSLKNDLDATDVNSLLNDQTFHLRLNEVREDVWLNEHYFKLQHGKYTELNKNQN